MVIKEGEASISHRRLRLQGRFRGHDNWGSVAVPKVPMSSPQTLLMRPELSGILLQLGGEMGTRFLSRVSPSRPLAGGRAWLSHTFPSNREGTSFFSSSS